MRALWFGRTDKIALATCLKKLNVSGAFLKVKLGKVPALNGCQGKCRESASGFEPYGGFGTSVDGLPVA